MADTTDIPITLLADLPPGQVLTPQQADDNMKALKALRDHVRTLTGGALIADLRSDGAGGVEIELVDGTVLGPVALPLIPIVPRGAWMAAATYAAGDIVRDAGVSYVVARPHVSTSVAADLAAGKLEILAQDGEVEEAPSDAGTYGRQAGGWTPVTPEAPEDGVGRLRRDGGWTPAHMQVRGAHDPALAYDAFQVVTHLAPGGVSPLDLDLYVAVVPIAAGGPVPEDGSGSWKRLTA